VVSDQDVTQGVIERLEREERAEASLILGPGALFTGRRGPAAAGL
jgi:hypothetical protein